MLQNLPLKPQIQHMFTYYIYMIVYAFIELFLKNFKHFSKIFSS